MTKRTARHGGSPAPYTRYRKVPWAYRWETRLANGDLKVKANQSLRNKYP